MAEILHVNTVLCECPLCFSWLRIIVSGKKRSSAVLRSFFLLGFFLILASVELCAQTFRETNTFWERSISVNFSGSELRENLERFAKIQKIGFILDRRIDPGLTLDFSVNGVSGEEMFEQLAENSDLGFLRLDSVAYLGPQEAADKLNALLYLQEKQLERVNPTEIRFWTQSTSFTSNRLDTPKEILEKLAQKHRIRITNLEKLPHDLWPELDFPEISLNELFLVLLIGFNATFERKTELSSPGARTITIVPVSKNLPIAQAKRERALKNSEKSSAANTRQTAGIFTNRSSGDRTTSTKSVPISKRRFQMVRVRNKTLQEFLDYISAQVELEITIDEKSLQKKGIDLQQRISFELDQGDIHALMKAALNPLNASYQLSGKKLRVY